jgi:hypothetical protein
MTVTIVYGVGTDGYLSSGDVNYTTARNGPADTVSGGNTGYYGQNNNGGSYQHHQTFVGFNYTMPPTTELVAAAVLQLYQSVQLATGIARDLEVRGRAWQASGLTTADWANGTTLGAARLDGVVKNVQGSVSKLTQAGSDNMLQEMSTHAAMDWVLVTSRQRAGTTATGDEAGAISLSETTGTSFDPRLVYTSATWTHFTPALGAMAQLSDGSSVLLIHGQTTAATVGSMGLWRVDLAGVATNLGSVPVGTAATDFGLAKGAQGFTLTVDSADNIYVVGKAGNTGNSLALRAFTKGAGWTWTAGTVRTVAMPTHDAAINNVAAAWHPTANGTLVVLAAHTAGQGVAGGTGNDLAWALLDATYLRTGAGTLSRASGSALGGMQPAITSSEFNTYANESGTGLDVVRDLAQPDWGYVISFQKGQLLGDNTDLAPGRYILNAAGNGFTHTSYEEGVAWGRKDAGARARVLAVGNGQVVVVTADADAGWGITVEALQASGTTAGLTALGGRALADEGMASMPDGPAIAGTSLWDAIYNAAENSVWVYYRHAANTGQLYRTSLDLNTYQPTRQEVLVFDFGTEVITSVRVPRNGSVTQKGVYQVCTLAGATLKHYDKVDLFNLAPTAPVLTPRANFDASAAATFAWAFSDPNPGDTQSAYELEVERTDTSAVALDTGKVTSTTSSRVVTGGTFTNGVSYRWRVRVWDAGDTVSPWSDWGTFSTSAGGTVTITDPATDNLTGVVTDEVQVTWSVTGTTQAAYRVTLTRTDTGATVSDSGWIASTTATTYLVTGMVSGVEHQVGVQVRNASLVVSGIGTRKITPNYGVPEVPLVTVAPVPDEGYVLVSVDNPLSGQPELGTEAWTFETGGVAPWTSNSATVADSTEQAHGGTHSLKLTVTGTPTQAYVRAYNDKVPVVETERYTARMWVYVPVARTVTAAIDWAAAGTGAYVGTSALDWPVPAATWTEIQVTGTCPTGAGEASYGPTLGANPATGTVLYLDDVILVAASDRPAVVRNRVLRRKAGSGDPWEVLGTCDPDGSFRDYTAPGRVPVEYMIRGESA